MARLLVNYVLIRSGYLPLIVPTGEKEDYLTALRLADASELSALMAYLQRRLEWSLQLGIKAAKGQSIEDPSDLEKEIAIFVRNQQEHKDKVVFRSPEVLRELFDSGLREFVEKFDTKLNKLIPLFRNHLVTTKIKPELPNTGDDPIKNLELVIQTSEHNSSFTIQHRYQGYLDKAPNPFDVSAETSIAFGENRYVVNVAAQNLIVRAYSEPVLSDEAESLANKALAHAFAEIKKLSDTQE